MNSKTKIIVLHMKELIYTGIFVLFALFLIILLVVMFHPQKSSQINTNLKNTSTQNPTDETVLYTPGVYTASLTLNGNVVDVEVTVDSDHINSIRLVNLNDSVTAMYPLVEPSFDEIVSQIYKTQSLEGISYADENKYTSMVILDAISKALGKSKQ